MPLVTLPSHPRRTMTIGSQCLMCKSTQALPDAELCARCQREFEGLSEKPCLAVLRFDMAQRTAFQTRQRTEQARLKELKSLFLSRSRLVLGNSEEDEMLPMSSGALRATARREIAELANVVPREKGHRSPRGTIRHKLESLANSEAKHEAARAAMRRRRRIRRGEKVSSSEEEEEGEEEEEEDQGSKRPRADTTEPSKIQRRPKHVVAHELQQIRRNVAFLMGIHRRVGQASPIFGLPEVVVKSILSAIDDVLVDLTGLAEHSYLSPMGPSKATRGAVTTMVADTATWRLFAGGADGSIVVWNYCTCSQQQVLRGHSSAIQALMVIRGQTTAQDDRVDHHKNTGVCGLSSSAERSTDDSSQMSLLQLRFPEQSLDSLRRLLRYHGGDANAAAAYVEAHIRGDGIQETTCVAASAATPAGATSDRGQSSTPPRGSSKVKRKVHIAEQSATRPTALSNFVLVSGCTQGAVVWTAKRGGCLTVQRRLHHISGGVGPVDSITALAGGGARLPLLVCGGKRREVHLWDLQSEPTGSVGLRHSMVGHNTPITALVMPHQDQAAARMHLYMHSKTSETTTSGTASSADAAQWLWCISGCADGTIRRWDLVRGVTTHILEGHDSPVTSLSLTLVRCSSSNSDLHKARATETAHGVGFWRLFSGGDTNDGCIRCWDTFECFNAATEASNTPYRYDHGGRALSAAQATASGSSRLLGHKLEVGSGVKSMHWVAPCLVDTSCGFEGKDDGGASDTACTDHAGWICCTLMNQTIIGLRAADCARRGKINLASTTGGRNLQPPVSSLVGVFRSTVASARSRERVMVGEAAATVVVPLPLPSREALTAEDISARAKNAVMVVCATGDKMRLFATNE